MDTEKLAEAKAQYPEGQEVRATVRGKEYVALIRPPTRAEFKRFRAMTWDERKRADAQETLIRSCIAYPGPEEVDAMFNAAPALADRWAEVAMELAGAPGKDTSEG